MELNKPPSLFLNRSQQNNTMESCNKTQIIKYKILTWPSYTGMYMESWLFLPCNFMIDNNDNLRNLTQFYGQIFIRALKVFINKEKILNARYIGFFFWNANYFHIGLPKKSIYCLEWVTIQLEITDGNIYLWYYGIFFYFHKSITVDRNCGL